jgi:hypothetical protein
MRTKAKNPAFPLVTDEGYVINAGLNKREFFALMAMQGFITKYGVDCQEEHIKQAVFIADFFIGELNKKKTND